MAHIFPDCLGEIDVVSSAENIKNLLKLPYSAKSGISLMIHRIENTLLIDEFDIHKYLLRQSDDEWKWLKSFICEHILTSLGDADRRCYLKSKSREALQKKHLLSKFLYHSLTGSESGTCSTQDENISVVDKKSKNRDTSKATPKHQARAAAVNANTQLKDLRPLDIKGPLLPESSVEENVPDPLKDYIYNRNVVWTFEDIRMLIGTDMPIFGSANRPCISLRLRDMSQPINVLTGIDYWLDNLMCNVPDVVMCYHLDGLVQKYEIIKTEDLPFLENSKFSPKVIRNVAQNILAFLKQNATKAGHTYWLFKGRNDDFVKLYDLTSLCSNADNPATNSNSNGSEAAGTSTDTTTHSDTSDNPFIVPVAMLLYKVARNMKNMAEKNMSAKQAGSIKTLLDNCIQLLPKEKYPQIVTSSHYILSDLHVPAGINPNAPNFKWSNEEEEEDPNQSVFDDQQHESDCDANSETGSTETVTTTTTTSTIINQPPADIVVKNISETLKEFNLQKNWKHNASPPPIVSDVGERCQVALKHIADGLGCLQYFSSNEEKLSKEKEEIAKLEEKRKIILEELNPNMAKSSQAIPLPYEKLKTDPKELDPRKAIPMGWKEGVANYNTTPAATSKKSKRNRKKSITKGKTKDYLPTDDYIGAEEAFDSPRSLLLKGKSGVIESWNVHLKLLLLEKACLTYATLTEQSYHKEQYGTSLKYIMIAMQCQRIVTKHMASVSSQKQCLLGRAGDCYFQLAKNVDSIEEHLQQFCSDSDIDAAVKRELQKDEGHDEQTAELPTPTNNIEELMLTSCGCYESALGCTTAESSQREFVSRLGSVRNELGIRYMHWAQQEYARYLENDSTDENLHENGTAAEPLYQIFIRKSYDCLIRGIGAFEEIGDNANLAILLCNMGRFMRFRAHVVMLGEW